MYLVYSAHVYAVDSDDGSVTDMGEEETTEAEASVVDLRRGEGMSDWKDGWGTFVAALPPGYEDADAETIAEAVLMVHLAERLPERFLAADRGIRALA